VPKQRASEAERKELFRERENGVLLRELPTRSSGSWMHHPHTVVVSERMNVAGLMVYRFCSIVYRTASRQISDVNLCTGTHTYIHACIHTCMHTYMYA
jgi:hypothetical protein